jgi:hypothetical protein
MVDIFDDEDKDIGSDKFRSMVNKKQVIKDLNSVGMSIDSASMDSANVITAILPSTIVVEVVSEFCNVRMHPSHISLKHSTKSKGSKLSFDDIVTGSLIENSDKWYKLTDGGFVHDSQVKEVNRINEINEINEVKETNQVKETSEV